MPVETPAVRRYYPQLDGVRALAVTMVIVFHMAQMGVRIPGPTILGQTGVDLFFVLSGFLITGILLKSPQGDWHAVRTFYVRRTLRIFPLYYAFLLGLVLTGQKVSASFWLYLENIYIALNLPAFGPGHFWSLAVEEQFYLVWPFLVLFMPRRHLMKALWLMVLVAVACRYPLEQAHVGIFYFTLSRIDALAAGAILAVLEQANRLGKMRRLLFAVCGLSAVLLCAQFIAARHTPDLAWVQVTKYTAFAAFYASGIGILLTSAPSALSRVLGSSPLRFVGRISYGLYVFHPGVFAFFWNLRQTQIPAAARVLLGLVGTLACALLSWYVMEKQLNKLKDKLAPEPVRFPKSAPPMTTL